mmetsp:Transcript_31461/g.51283  ORF Transcript_31461/g.51283 Transcript_31461/m.51283 type:complete len:398 (-) Transcript_31461:318-1511(-)
MEGDKSVATRTMSMCDYLSASISLAGGGAAAAENSPITQLLNYLRSHVEDTHDLEHLVFRTSSLGNIAFHDQEVEVVVDALLASNISPKTLGFINSNITDSGVNSIANFLNDPSSALEELDLTGNNITGRGMEALAEALGGSITAKRVALGWNPLGARGGYALAALLQRSLSLEALAAPRCDLGVDATVALLEVLAGNGGLVELDLGDPARPAHATGLTDHLARLLGRNKTLQVLRLSKWRMRDEGAGLLSGAILEAPYIQGLHLSCNEIGITGAESLSSLLVKTSCLTELDLSNNRVGDAGARAFGLALQQNSSLKTLNVKFNSINDGGLADLARGVAQNSSLQKLLLWGNNFGQECAEEFDDLMKGRFQYLEVKVDIHPYLVDGAYHIAEVEDSP